MAAQISFGSSVLFGVVGMSVRNPRDAERAVFASVVAFSLGLWCLILMAV